jgi:hypothetical protein
MTQTFTTVVTHRLVNHGLSMKMALAATAFGAIVWNFEFVSLELI